MSGPDSTPVLGAVLCGGRSSRFGSDKALADAGGVPVGQRVTRALREVGVDPVAAIGGTAGPQLGLVTVPDLRPGEGPLAGLLTALTWARNHRVVVVPCDAVLLTPQHLTPLLATAAQLDRSPPKGPRSAVLATVDGKPQISLGCWPGEWSRDVLKQVDRGHRRFIDAIADRPWVGVEVHPDAVRDADTQEQLRSIVVEQGWPTGS